MLHFIPPPPPPPRSGSPQPMNAMSALRTSFNPVAATTASSSQSQSTKVSYFFNEVFKKYDASSSSASVTPITPMTPMTTPRTPLQILLGRNNNGVGGPFRRSSITRYQGSSCSAAATTTTLGGSCDEYDDDDDQYREKQRLALQLIANFLNNAESTLNDITERESSGQQVLGPGIVRVCHDLADEIENVAKELRKEHTRAARHLAHAISDHELTLLEEGGTANNNNNNNEGVKDEEVVNSNSEVEAVSTNKTALAHPTTLPSSESVASFQSQEEFISSLSTTHTLLIDTAAALRAITQQEAQELGEAALDVAGMFLWSLGRVHSNMIQMTMSSDYPYPTSQPLIISYHGKERQEQVGVMLPKKSTMAAGLPTSTTKQNRVTWYNENTKSHNGPVIEILGDEEKNDGSPQRNTTKEFRYSPRLPSIPSSPGASSIASSNISRNGSTGTAGHSLERVRVLWPPLLPAVTEAGKVASSRPKNIHYPPLLLDWLAVPPQF